MKRQHKPFDVRAALKGNPDLAKLNQGFDCTGNGSGGVLTGFEAATTIKTPNTHKSLSKASTTLKQAIKESQGKKLHRKFLEIWNELGGPELTREYQFHPIRKWRLDYVKLGDINVGIEIDGGTFIKGGHNRGFQIEKDNEKRNAATVRGWSIFVLSTSAARNREYIQTIVDFCKVGPI